MRLRLQDDLRRSAEMRPEHEAIVTPESRLDYRALWERSARLANALRERGVARGDRVAILMDNIAECPVALFGTWLADAAIVPLHPQTKADKLGWILRDSGAVALVTEAHLAEVFTAAVQGTEVRHVIATASEADGLPEDVDHFEAAVAAAAPEAPVARNVSLDLAAILYTSGTTGEPKGVVHTHGSLGFARDSVVEYLGLRGDDRLVCGLPLSFGYGLFQLLPATAVGATLLLERGFTYPARLFPRIEREGATTFAGVPTIFAMMIHQDVRRPLRLASVRLVTNAAAALPEGFLPALQRIFPNAAIVPMYGQTECIRACWLPPERAAAHPDSVGIAIPGAELLILDDEGREVGVGEAGILHVRGPNVMAGYWNDPARTGAALVPGPGPGERMLRTGDWFRRDAEGLHYFVSRSDDIIKSRGEKVSPTEVENAIYSLPEVAEVMVLGIPDPVLGQAVCALVTLRDGETLHENQVKRACLERLEGYMIPHRVLFVARLPRNERGKLSRLLAHEEFGADLVTEQPV